MVDILHEIFLNDFDMIIVNRTTPALVDQMNKNKRGREEGMTAIKRILDVKSRKDFHSYKKLYLGGNVFVSC